MKCSACGKDNAAIAVIGQGGYRLDCRNLAVESPCCTERIGHLNRMTAADANGRMCASAVTRMHFGHMVRWQAEEQDAEDGYLIAVDADPGDDPAEAFAPLRQKVQRRLSSRSIESRPASMNLRDSVWSNTATRGDWQHLSLDERCIARIIWSESDGIAISIDEQHANSMLLANRHREQKQDNTFTPKRVSI